MASGDDVRGQAGRCVRRGDSGGFTLLELMTVVAIIGIMAAVAIPAFIKYIRKAKTLEAVQNLETIVALQKVHKVDYGAYLALPANPKALTCKGKTPLAKVRWDVSPAWKKLGFHPDAELYYRYEVKLTKTGFSAEATSDLDCDGTRSLYRITERGGPIIQNEIE